MVEWVSWGYGWGWAGAGVALLGLWVALEWRRGAWMRGPWGLPLVGYLPFLHPDRLHEELTQLATRYGPLFSLRLGQKLVVVLSDPVLVRDALALPALAARPDSGLTALLARAGYSRLNFRSPSHPSWPRTRQLADRAAQLLLHSKRKFCFSVFGYSSQPVRVASRIPHVHRRFTGTADVPPPPPTGEGRGSECPGGRPARRGGPRQWSLLRPPGRARRPPAQVPTPLLLLEAKLICHPGGCRWSSMGYWSIRPSWSS